MAGLKTLLGLYPKTQDYEQKRKQLEDEYQALNEYETSDELARYKELEQFVNSEEFRNKQSELLGLRYKGSQEYLKEKEYLQLSKDSSLKRYYKTSTSQALKSYNDIKVSDILDKYKDLEKFINSIEFNTAKSNKKTFKNSEENKKYLEFKQLKKNPSIKHYFKFDRSKELANYNVVIGSSKLEKLEELTEYVKSEAFLEKKKYLTISPKLRWKQSDIYKKLEEFELLKKSEKIKWYFTNKGHKKFDWFKTWNLAFEDDFDTGKLDKKKWLTRYYWGEEMIQESYSDIDEKHAYTENNFEFNGSALKILTKAESEESKKWNPELGFIPTQFNYTSGLINTGKSFRQKYGLFEAKIKFDQSPNILNAFWMVGDKKVPHIDVAEAYKKCSFGIIIDDNKKIVKAIGRRRFSNDFHIFSMEWSADSIVWKINGLEVKTVKQNIPDEEMYLNFSAGLYKDIQQGLPASMEIDWVRCYKKS